MTSTPHPGPRRILIVAAAGYGKSAALAAELPAGSRRLTADAALHHDLDELSDANAVGVDDVERLAPTEQTTLVKRLAALPPDVGLVLASRVPLDRATLAGLRTPVLERGPGDLRLSAQAVSALLSAEYDVQDPEVAVRVHAATAGWPTLVRLAGDALVRDPDHDLVDVLSAPGSTTATWLTTHVIGALPDDLRAVLSLVGGLGPVPAAILDRVALVLGLAPCGAAVTSLDRLGLLVGRRTAGGRIRQDVVPVVAAVLSASRAPSPRDRDAYRTAALAYEEEGYPLAAVRASAAAGDTASVRRLVEARGEDLVRCGDAAALTALLEPLVGPGSPCDSPLVQRTYADALRLSGEPARALRAFRPLVESAGSDGWEVELATRVAAVHYTLGDYPATLETLDRARRRGSLPSPTEPVELVEWSALRVRTLSALGRHEEAALEATAMMRLAEDLAEPRALAAAHVAMARITDGSRKEAHHEQARLAAAESGDAVTTALVLVNQSHVQLASARFAEAELSAREAVRITDLSSPPGRRVAALHNLAEALTRLGRFDEAMWQLRRSIGLARQLGAGNTAVGLLGVADIHRQRGHDRQARAAYVEAVELARESQERQVLVPALAGLSLLDAGSATQAALETAREALTCATTALRPFALVALGWAALAAGEAPLARDSAAEAVEVSRSIGAQDLVAESLELVAIAAEDSHAAAVALTEARAIWRAGDAVTGIARTEVLLGGLEDADAAARARARNAAGRLQRLGITRIHGRPVTPHGAARTVGISVLGGFLVTVDGSPVPLSAWRSRQARTLVKVLAARRGRPLSRGHLCELLWPGDDPAKTGHRLSVLLAVVRTALDPDKRWPADWFVAADLDRVWLDLRHAWIDADDLVRDAAHATALLAEGAEERAAQILEDVNARYTGDAFEDEPVEEWADALREEARAAWTRCARQLVAARSRAGRAGDAAELLVRLLASDPYDEQAHRLLVRALVRTGRHGEARRAFDRWAEAMRALGAPLPDPAVLQHGPRRQGSSPVVTRR